MISGYKHCPSPLHEGRRWIPVSNFHAKKRNEEGECILLDSHCATCQRRKRRPSGKSRPTYSHIRVHSGHNGYEPKTPEERERVKAYRRERYRTRVLTPEEKENQRENRRFLREAQRRREGIKTRLKKKSVGRPIKVDVAPMAKYLRNNNITQVYGLDTNVISRIRQEKKKQETIDVIDRICIGLDDPGLLNELYPYSE